MSQSQKFPPTIVNANTLQGRERALKACAGGVAKTSGKQGPPSHLTHVLVSLLSLLALSTPQVL